MKKILFLACFTLFAAGCNSNGDQRDYDQMAKDLCDCMRPLADINQKIKTLVAEGKNQEVVNLFTKIEQIAAEGEACATALEDKYGVVEDENEAKATAALQKHCPAIAAMLENEE